MKRKAAPQITSFFTKRSDPKNIQESNDPTTSSTTPPTSANDNASKLPTQSFEAIAQPTNKHHVNPTANSVDNIPGSLVNGFCQPKLKCYPKGQQNRCFKACWYSRFPWLEYSTKEDKAFCIACRNFSTPSSKSDAAFAKMGFNSWSKALEKNRGRKGHNSSSDHLLSMTRWECFEKNKGNPEGSIAHMLDPHRASRFKITANT